MLGFHVVVINILRFTSSFFWFTTLIIHETLLFLLGDKDEYILYEIIIIR
jgi:hypothetical protein